MSNKSINRSILLSLFLLFGSLWADHFTNVWTGNGYQHMNFYITSAQINDISLGANDEIAVYDESYCVAHYKLTAPISNYLPLAASCDDPTTTAVDGYRPGNPVTFKIWDSENNLEYSEPDLNVIYLSGTAVFQIGASAVVQINYSSNPLYNLTLSVNPEYSGTLSGYGAYEANTPVTIHVSPNPNYRFLNWTDSNNIIISTNNPFSFNMPSNNLNYIANLEYYVNQAPQLIFPALFTFNEDTPVTANFEQYMSDPDNDLSELTLTATPGSHVLVFIEGHNVTFGSPFNWNGQEDITFTLNDNVGRAIDTEVLHVSVNSVNDAPFLTQTVFSAVFDEDTVYQGANLYTMFDDVDIPYGDVLMFTGEPSAGLNVSFENDMFVLTPQNNWYGSGIVILTATDSAGESAQGVITVTVNSVPDMPVINSWLPAETQISINAGESVSFSISAFDGDNDPLTYIWRLNGEIMPVNDSLFSWTFQNEGTFSIQADITDQVYTITRLWNVFVGPSSSEELPLSLKTSLKQNYPNPFNPSTCIAYSLKQSTPVKLDIYNSKGQLVKTLVNSCQNQGQYMVEWNGTDQQNTAVASGIYLYRLQTNECQIINRMILIK